MTLASSGALETGANNQYICTLVRGESLCQFDLLSDEVDGTNPLIVENITLGLDSYFSPMNSLSKQKHMMRHGIRKPCGLKVKQYAVGLIFKRVIGFFLGRNC